MRKIFYSILSLAVFVSCTSNSTSEVKEEITSAPVELQYFGEQIDIENALNADNLLASMGESDSLSTKFEGVVVEVCQQKGCWMKIDLGEEKTIRVTFKDYGFFMPKDIAGKTVVMDGYAKKTVTSVAKLRHFAEDAGKPKEEIEAITDPLEEVTFLAYGVVLK
jgi:hypothetical protein